MTDELSARGGASASRATGGAILADPPDDLTRRLATFARAAVEALKWIKAVKDDPAGIEGYSAVELLSMVQNRARDTLVLAPDLAAIPEIKDE